MISIPGQTAIWQTYPQFYTNSAGSEEENKMQSTIHKEYVILEHTTFFSQEISIQNNSHYLIKFPLLEDYERPALIPLMNTSEL